MVAIRPIHRGWKESLVELIGGAQRELLVVAPYMTAEGLSLVADHLSEAVFDRGHLEMVTDLSPAHVCDGSLDTDAIAALVTSHHGCGIWHVPALHAKVYIADRSRAIVTSGNLTAGAFYRNAEYGLEILDAGLVRRIRADMSDIQIMGAQLDADSMRHYAQAARAIRETIAAQRSSVDPTLTHAFENAIQTAKTELVRLRLAGGAMHTVFARTILILLARHGPMQTTSIHPMIQRLHQDLCDDTVDRVIDGKRFGKKWKHAVRTAQQQLKKRGLVEYDGQVWALTGNRDDME